MTIINLTPCENGAYANQTKDGAFKRIPEGWAVVPVELEDNAKEYLPWVSLTVEGGSITAICDNAEAREAWQALENVEDVEEEVEANGN